MAESVFVNHYATLGLNPHAGPPEVKRRFRELAKVHHPDRAGGDGLKFLEVYNAYRVLADPETRRGYDRKYVQYMNRTGMVIPDRAGCIRIPVRRLIFPGNVAMLARRGLLRKKFRSRDRKRILKIDYDVELPLSDSELGSLLKISIPLVVRATCPECLGSNPHCGDCGGRGSYKTSRNISFYLEGGLVHGQVIEIDLKRVRLDRLSNFKKPRLRIKISRLEPKHES
jgi:molecular chaperone DnaJ